MAKPIFNQQLDRIGLFCAKLPNHVSQGFNQLCRQAREEERPRRLDEKITDQKHRRIYDSFCNPNDKSDAGLPWHILNRLVPREFDFEDAASRDEEAAVSLCRDILAPANAEGDRPRDLWKELLDIARELRDVGGSVTRESLASRLPHKFKLRDDPLDLANLTTIRVLTQEWMGQVDSTLAGGLTLPRRVELDGLRKTLGANRALHMLGASGSGKSALVKALAAENAKSGAEIVWLKADQFPRLVASVPDFVAVLQRIRSPTGLLIFDGLDTCYSDEVLDRIGHIIGAISGDTASPWKVLLICQSPSWSHVSRRLVNAIAGHDALTREVQCGELSEEEMALVFSVSPSIRRLSLQPHLSRMLRSPKMLDLLLRGQVADNLRWAGEADLVDWWWDEQVKGGKQFAGEEKIARDLAVRMAGELATELSPDTAVGPAESVENLLKRRVLRRTGDGRLRFDHDLLADWSRVMHLRVLGDEVVAFMRLNAENPPWLRAIRLLSQHLLERTQDVERWRSVVTAYHGDIKHSKEPPAEDLQVLDAWLEGIAFCANSAEVLNVLRADLFADDGWLLRRFTRRLLHTGTIPDPIVQQRYQELDVRAAEAAAIHFRLPLAMLWQPFAEFLTANPEEATDFLPVELTEIGGMWARLEGYLNFSWPAMAALIVLNGEKELRREVAGEYRHEPGSRGFGSGKESRVSIYRAAVQAASQLPDRVAKLTLKAAGRIAWEEGEVPGRADREWRGEWHDRPLGHYGNYVRQPVEPWPDGPTRRVSRDFRTSFLEGEAALALFKLRPQLACEAALALLIDWPKEEIVRGHHSTGVEHHGFQLDAYQMYPAFWTKGPFILFLRQDWRPALDLLIRLTNFATDRYEDWWPYNPGVAEIAITTPQAQVRWKGNHQIYGWNRYHMNTPHVVTCGLMALEKWLDEQVEAKISISDAVDMLYLRGRSLAFAGVLVSIGKRHPEKFANDLKALLFRREIYMYDLQIVQEQLGAGYSPRDGKLINKLRAEWNQLPGRKKWLKEACGEWVVTKPELQSALAQVSAAWRHEASSLPEGSEDRRVLLCWAADFDRSLRKEVTLPDGRKAWHYERPAELRDEEGEQALQLRQSLLFLPHQCSDLLEKRPELSDEQIEEIWRRLQNWDPYEKAAAAAQKEDSSSAQFIDHRHARSGLLAVLLCLGQTWLQKNPARRVEVEAEVQKLLADQPKPLAFTEDDAHDDCESFLARCVVRCWAAAPDNREWRGTVGGFVTAYRYRTVRHLFDEAFRVRSQLRDGYRELEALALSLAVARREATRLLFLRTRREVDSDAIQAWSEKWLQLFADGKGPALVSDWSTIEKLEDFAPKTDSSHGMGGAGYEVHRRDYGLDMGVVFATFDHLPALNVAGGLEERAHWLDVCKQMLGAFCRTLPPNGAENEEWKYDPWSADEKVFDTIARRLFECSKEERPALWQPLLNLPTAAHHHITQFLNAVLLEAVQTEPPRIEQLVPIWREMADHLRSLQRWREGTKWETGKVWTTILLHGAPFTTTGEEIFAPLIDNLRDLFEWHANRLAGDAHDESSFASFLTTKAGERLLVDALAWLGDGWASANGYFWETVAERGHFELLLERAWRQHGADIRRNPRAFKAFKLLTINLASKHVPGALEIQRQLGTEASDER